MLKKRGVIELSFLRNKEANCTQRNLLVTPEHK